LLLLLLASKGCYPLPLPTYFWLSQNVLGGSKISPLEGAHHLNAGCATCCRCCRARYWVLCSSLCIIASVRKQQILRTARVKSYQVQFQSQIEKAHNATGCNGLSLSASLSWDLVFSCPGHFPGQLAVDRSTAPNHQAPPGKPPRRRTDSPLHHLFPVERPVGEE
jgi:hypothetical protein